MGSWSSCVERWLMAGRQRKVDGLAEQGAAAEAVAEMRRLQGVWTVRFLDVEAAILLAGSM